jgi:1-acyl-sn-glycerol-3-phosphate acyltransferase
MLTIPHIILGVVLLWCLYRAGYWTYQGYLIARYPGYIVPEKSFITRHAIKVLAWLFTLCLVGRIRVIHKSNAKFDGRLLILPNHSHMVDFAVAERALPMSYKQVGTVSEVAKGFRSPFGAWAGFIAIDTTGGKANSKAIGERTVNSYGRALSFRSRARLLIFPQGVLMFSGHIVQDPTQTGSMRTGAIRGARLAQQVIDAIKAGDATSLALVRKVHGQQADAVIAYYRKNPAALDEPLAFLPVSIEYNRHHKDTDKVNIFSKIFGGATVVVGEPVLVSSLPEDPREASEQVRLHIESLMGVR